MLLQSAKRFLHFLLAWKARCPPVSAMVVTAALHGTWGGTEQREKLKCWDTPSSSVLTPADSGGSKHRLAELPPSTDTDQHRAVSVKQMSVKFTLNKTLKCPDVLYIYYNNHFYITVATCFHFQSAQFNSTCCKSYNSVCLYLVVS